MHHDGMDNPKFTFCGLKDHRGATHSRKFSVAMFEVLPETEEREFKDPNHNQSKTFWSQSARSFTQKLILIAEAESMSGESDTGKRNRAKPHKTKTEMLDELNEDLKKATQKKKQKSPRKRPLQKTKPEERVELSSDSSTHKKEMKRESKPTLDRISKMPEGWSVSKRAPKSGSLPVCVVCKKKIKREEMRVQNHHKR